MDAMDATLRVYTNRCIFRIRIPRPASRPARPILIGEASARRTSFAWRDASATLASPTESSASPCGGDAAPKLRWRERARSGGHGSHCESFEDPGRVEKEGSVTRRDRGRGQRAESGYRGSLRPQEPRRGRDAYQGLGGATTRSPSGTAWPGPTALCWDYKITA